MELQLLTEPKRTEIVTKLSDVDFIEKEGYILLIDACGISALENTELRDTVGNIILSEQFLNLIGNEINQDIQEFDIDIPKIEYLYFQDTLIVSFEYKSYNIAQKNITATLNDIAAYINHSLALNKIFWRGAITYGKFFKTEIGYFGSAVNEVAKIYEKARFFGILCTDAIVSMFPENSILELPWITKEYVPVKDSNNKTTQQQQHILNWYLSLLVTHLPEDIVPKNIVRNSGKLCYCIDKYRTDMALDKKIELYENTKKVICDFLEKKYPKYNKTLPGIDCIGDNIDIVNKS